MANKIYIGTAAIELPKEPYLYIFDEVPDIPYAKVFDHTKHRINPVNKINYRKASDIVENFDALFSRGDSTLTKDTGLDFIAEALEGATSLEGLIAAPGKKSSTGEVWAYGKVQRLMRSPVLKNVLNGPVNFSFNERHTILVRLNRAELGDFDCLVLGLFLIGQYQGQVVIPDLGFYGRNMHVSLIRENRLIAGIRSLRRLPEVLRDEVLYVDDKVIRGATYRDAVALAEEAGLRPDQLREDNEFNKFVDRAICPPLI